MLDPVASSLARITYNQPPMEPKRIGELLHPFLPTQPEKALLENISIYIDMLIRWNSRINLTAIRDPEEIVTRHFGESLLAASHLFPTGLEAAARSEAATAVDLGSGAGFPGLPIKLWAPHIHLTLIESNQKKSTFLREVIRALGLTDAEVFSARAETFPPSSANLVTLRAVEHFESALAIATRLVLPAGRIALLIGEAQSLQASAQKDFVWDGPIPIPMSKARILLTGTRWGNQ